MAIHNFVDDSDVASVLKTNETNLDKAANKALGYVAIANASGQTLTAAQICGKNILRSGATAVSDTLPTATQILTQLGTSVAIGDVFSLTIRNNNSGLLTIVAGSGVTLEGTTSIATSFARHYLGRVTAVTSPAVTLSGMYTAAV